ncbi:MAG: hypothetical protein M9908_14645 [Phyllobacteriaceae bacterium]|nr:hypothetical protein [Phyllobacteriaceae bacterium]
MATAPSRHGNSAPTTTADAIAIHDRRKTARQPGGLLFRSLNVWLEPILDIQMITIESSKLNLWCYDKFRVIKMSGYNLPRSNSFFWVFTRAVGCLLVVLFPVGMATAQERSNQLCENIKVYGSVEAYNQLEFSFINSILCEFDTQKIRDNMKRLRIAEYECAGNRTEPYRSSVISNIQKFYDGDSYAAARNEIISEGTLFGPDHEEYKDKDDYCSAIEPQTRKRFELLDLIINNPSAKIEKG